MHLLLYTSTIVAIWDIQWSFVCVCVCVYLVC